MTVPAIFLVGYCDSKNQGVPSVGPCAMFDIVFIVITFVAGFICLSSAWNIASAIPISLFAGTSLFVGAWVAMFFLMIIDSVVKNCRQKESLSNHSNVGQ